MKACWIGVDLEPVAAQGIVSAIASIFSSHPWLASIILLFNFRNTSVQGQIIVLASTTSMRLPKIPEISGVGCTGPNSTMPASCWRDARLHATIPPMEWPMTIVLCGEIPSSLIRPRASFVIDSTSWECPPKPDRALPIIRAS